MSTFRRLNFKRLYQNLLRFDDRKTNEKENIFIKVYKFLYRNIGLLVVILISFWIESSGEKYITRQRYYDMIQTIKVDIDSFKVYTYDYSERITQKRDFYKKQYEIWDNDSDSVFVNCEYEPCFVPLAFFKDFEPFTPSVKGFNMFEKGGIEFEFMYPTITNMIYKLYNEDLEYIKINASLIDEKYANDFESRVADKWAVDLEQVELKKDQFWVKNRHYIQKDKRFKYNLYRRVVQWDQTLEQLDEFEKKLDEVLISLDSLTIDIDDNMNLFYWEFKY